MSRVQTHRSERHGGTRPRKGPLCAPAAHFTGDYRFSPRPNVRFATPGHIPGSEQKRTFTILHCEAVFNLVLKNNEPLQSFGNAKPLVNEMAAPFVHETCLYAVFEYEAMDRSL